MPKNINAASRLHAVLQQAAGMSTNASSLAVWENIFQIQEEPNEARKAVLISDRLRWMHQQLEIARSQMKQANLSENLYIAAFNNIEQAISTLILTAQWNNGVQYLKPETLLALEFCSEILPDEESLIDPHVLEEIRSMVQELEKSLAVTDLPESLVALILNHIELINRALNQYPITGAKALREAARTALGELVEAKDEVKGNNKTPEVSQLGRVWGKINNSADVAIKADKIAQLGSKAWTYVENLLT